MRINSDIPSYCDKDSIPQTPPKFCDGCNAAFSIFHALNWKKGGLVKEHHNKLRDRVADLDGKAFTSTHMRDNPLIFAGSDVKNTKSQPAGPTHPPKKQKSEATEQKGYLLIPDLCHNATESVHDMRVVKTDSKFHLAKTSEKCI